jgi:hypothetical protein
MRSGYSNLPHRNAKAALARDFFGSFVPRVDVAHDSRTGVVDQDARHLLGGEIGAVNNEHLATVNRTADANTATVVE